ncbi:MAG: Membrane-bound lytic murein transglycosylase A [Stenotrophomonas maltophilia]|uniref:Membrane-bound lytic murein transglycosylase A n=1 Tax=Stenotrophomonas maltophilia TaxID=40324 RepID=A0A7V8FDU8_STEMA|nr:MAG: Membrane-bound lytic murein transglycosylase A [Stenotrophomonas maltophilia]
MMITATSSPRPLLTFLAVALLAGCSTTAPRPDAPARPGTAGPYAKVEWSALPAVSDADLRAGFLAWHSACPRLKTDAIWATPCTAAATVPDSDPAAIRQFLQRDLDVYALRAAGNRAEGLITGYYEPIYSGSLARTDKATVPVYGVPDDMVIVQLDSLYPELKGKRLRGRLDGKVLKPYDDAGTIASKGAKAPVLAWLTDPMDLQLLQIQGSGRVRLADGTQVRLAYADQNSHPYRAIGRWLVDQGQLKKEDVSMEAIRAWARANPARVPEMLRSNPSYVFFSRNPDSPEGPRGSLNVPLTAGYSVAVDRTVVPLGSLMWLSTTRPDGSALVRPVAAQDTGGAIAGEVRADLYWGTGDAAGDLAGHMKQQGRLWMLWPKGAALPN